MALISVNLPWLAQVTEEIIDPTRRIIDPHHHFFVASHFKRIFSCTHSNIFSSPCAWQA